MSPEHNAELGSLIERMRAGDARAVEELWQRFFQELVRVAAVLLRRGNLRVADGEDAALSALHSFCEGAQQGRFPELDGGANQLWQLLVRITINKALNMLRSERTQKRGGGEVKGESVLGLNGPEGEAWGIEQIVCSQPTPELAAQLDEDCRRLLDALEDDVLRRVAVMKMEGYTNEEIAGVLKVTVRTIERKLRSIRAIWVGEDANA
jgi:DNA-directed RNA polymerase specialized sigma24 family protein